MTLVRLEPAAPRSQVKLSTTEPLRSLVEETIPMGNNLLGIVLQSNTVSLEHV